MRGRVLAGDSIRPGLKREDDGVIAIHASIDTPMGRVGVAVEEGVLVGIDLEPEGGAGTPDDLPPSLREALEAYFRDGSVGVEVTPELRGTPFQRRVWAELRTIPPGRTVSYGDLAGRLGTSARAVGGACRANPCPIVVPCHRVVGRDGLGGFAGDTSGRKLAVKRWLLRHEGNLDY